LIRLNPSLPKQCIQFAIDELSKSRASLTPVIANKEVYHLIKNGVPVSFENTQGREENSYVKVLDFEEEENNDFLVVSQLSILYQNIGIEYDMPTRRPDLVLYVNGLPLVMIELKNKPKKSYIHFHLMLQRF